MQGARTRVHLVWCPSKTAGAPPAMVTDMMGTSWHSRRTLQLVMTTTVHDLGYNNLPVWS